MNDSGLGNHFGRYRLDHVPLGIELRVDQRRINFSAFAVGAAMIAGAIVLRSEAGEPIPSAIGLTVAGACLILFAVAGAMERRRTMITENEIIYDRPDGDIKERWNRDRLSHIELVQPPPPPRTFERRRHKRPWKIRLVDREGQSFRGQFVLIREDDAVALTKRLSDHLGVEFKKIG